MYVVGEYILVEPFPLEKMKIETGEKKPVSLVGTVVSVGKDVEEYIQAGTIVHLVEGAGHCPSRIGKRFFFRTILQNIVVCYDNMKEYKKSQRDQKALEEEEQRGARKKAPVVSQLITPTGTTMN